MADYKMDGRGGVLLESAASALGTPSTLCRGENTVLEMEQQGNVLDDCHPPIYFHIQSYIVFVLFIVDIGHPRSDWYWMCKPREQ